METATQQKWNAWTLVKKLTKPTLRSMFECWTLITQYRRLARQHAAYAKEWRQQRVNDLTSEAARAAASHDTYKAYQLINRLAPKTHKRRIQLRDKGGMPLGPLESHTAMTHFVRSTCADPHWMHSSVMQEVQLNAPALTEDQMPFTCQQLEQTISHLKWSKAVASPYASGGSLAPFAYDLAQHVYHCLQLWWGQSPPFVPPAWKNSWLVWLTKPNKPADTPENLRPLALQEPIGKCVMTLLATVVRDHAEEPEMPSPE